ncbi:MULTISPECIES: phosphotransferase [unclassified Streptomyces]|uniref:phosphotransferase n=1 Tax=unclassified Streptomyces TaxID=2593676 RepID=UPI000DDBA83E|nr:MULTISPECIES: phosphotransferase [unclassified Streptomyces]QZZ27424.1 alpha/beta fold hydrolase [Streptomyces sp. ST1015]
MPELTSFGYDHAGEVLSGVYGGPAGAPAAAVLLHGAGRGSKARLLPLADEFAAHGVQALALDFTGHGESTGHLGELSLERRFEQAVAVIDAYVPAELPLILTGFSMSGQTVADLTAHYGDRVTAIALAAPAVYAPEAWTEPFGEGAGRFTEIIRTPDAWRRSAALDVLREFTGRALLLVPETDEVIPPEVTEAIEDALTARAQYTRVELTGAEHQLGLWYRDHADARKELVTGLLTGLTDRGWTATWEWLAERTGRARVDDNPLKGGWSSQMRRVTLDDTSHVVLRSFVKPFFRRHAPGLLQREADILTLLAKEDGIPAADLVAVDPDATHCDHPSLAMTALPGQVRFDEDDLEHRLDQLAALLARIHAVDPVERPRDYQAWTSADRVRTPRGDLWTRAVDLIRREPPAYEPCFLHRDFHPGNVLFHDGRVTGVVDWVETSWGPADLDVAHCSTALALLHGPEAGLGFRERYEAHGGRPLAPGPDHLYWRLLDCLHYAGDATKLAGPWRESGRTDLTPELLGERLETYVRGLLATYA